MIINTTSEFCRRIESTKTPKLIGKILNELRDDERDLESMKIAINSVIGKFEADRAERQERLSIMLDVLHSRKDTSR